jgi:hypothetical protein
VDHDGWLRVPEEHPCCRVEALFVVSVVHTLCDKFDARGGAPLVVPAAWGARTLPRAGQLLFESPDHPHKVASIRIAL